MGYQDIPLEELILIYLEFIARGIEVPQAVLEALGDDLVSELDYQETEIVGDQEP